MEEASPSEGSSPPIGGAGAFASGAAAGATGGVAAGNAAVGGVAGSAVQAGTPLASTPTAFATQVCDKIWSCCRPEELAMLVVGMNAADCAAAFGASLELDVVEYTTSVAAGRAIYDGVMFEACLRDYDGRLCEELRMEERIRCFDAVRPLVSWGGTCGANFECIDGYCDGGSGAARPAGKCAVRKADGSACTSDPECASRHCDVVIGCAAAPPPSGLCGG